MSQAEKAKSYNAEQSESNMFAKFDGERLEADAYDGLNTSASVGASEVCALWQPHTDEFDHLWHRCVGGSTIC